jgi:hypothetical protein
MLFRQTFLAGRFRLGASEGGNRGRSYNWAMARTGPVRSQLAGFFGSVSHALTLATMRSRIGQSAVISALVIPATALAAYSRATYQSGSPGEYRLFGPLGADLLRGNLGAVYSGSVNQAGPFELAPYGIARLLDLHGVLAWSGFYVLVLYVMTFVFVLALFGVIGSRSGRWSTYTALAATALGVFGLFLPMAVFLGHPSEVLIPILWVLAARFARERQFALAGVLVALSAGFEVWGVLGAPVVFLAFKPRLIPSAAAALVALAVIYLPFVATGHFAMFGYHWRISSLSLYPRIWPGMVTFPWTLRLAQAALALAAGVAVALAGRRADYGILLVPFAILCVRLLLDPVLWTYYWIAPATVALLALAAFVVGRRWILSAFAALIIVWLWFSDRFPVQTAIAFVVLVIACAIVLATRGQRAGTSAAPAARK